MTGRATSASNNADRISFKPESTCSSVNEGALFSLEKIFSKSESPLLRPAKMDQISSVVSFLLSEKASYISGQIIRIDGAQSPYPI